MKSDAEYKELSIKEFTKAAEVYDSDHAGIYEMCKDDYPPILAELRKGEFEDLLDVGCGTGPMVELLAAEMPDKHYTGLDLTPRMIEVANAKGIGNARFAVGWTEPVDGDLRFAYLASVEHVDHVLREQVAVGDDICAVRAAVPFDERHEPL